ncbi:sulfur carrier protein ThiS [Corynebacterium ciconiae DSM 44920]|uniref:MoaD/ThiS family protein n=1 Tax=Corynebacterium ciconiae TaxID=227319 RepID=UPI00036DB46D|nr:MoaD/ThiS family protein [Corynebacterium ciconiae]WKD60976.1 sulfur carrier protein ThiS [Corynebacterium ciconiae DSM 44920]
MTNDLNVKVRFFAAAADAVGCEQCTLSMPAHATVADARAALAQRYPAAASVLGSCAVFIDDHLEADSSRPLETVESMDLLPPFAGG